LAEKQQTYETTFIVNASLDDAQIDAVIAKVEELITKNGGTVASVQRMGRRRLAYTIQKKNNGFYVSIEFRAPADLVPKLDRHFHLEENVFRYLSLRLTSKALKSREAAAAAAQAAVVEATPETAAPESVPS
jgi:small subunit ribosomal protein S6